MVSTRTADDGSRAPAPAPGDGPDEVDRIVAAWRRLAPDLPVEPLEIFSRVTRLARHLDLARREACRAHGLQVWEFDVLSALHRSGEDGQLTAGQLLSQTLVSSGTMSNRLDRLAAKGLATREPHPVDGRVVQVRITDAGRAAAQAAMASLLRRESQLVASLPEADRPQLAALLRTLLTPLDS